MENPRPRFSRKVENYIKYRPRYPQAIIDLLQRECDLTTTAVIADIGPQAFQWFDREQVIRENRSAMMLLRAEDEIYYWSDSGVKEHFISEEKPCRALDLLPGIRYTHYR